MFAERLKTLRSVKKITQEELAKEISVTKGAVAMWETEKRMPDLDMIKKIANYFEVSLDWLVGNSDIMQNTNELNDVYFSFAKQAQDDGILPEDIELAIAMIQKLKNKDL